MDFGEFKTFEDADGFLSEKFQHLPEAQYEIERGEYYIVPKTHK